MSMAYADHSLETLTRPLLRNCEARQPGTQPVALVTNDVDIVYLPLRPCATGVKLCFDPAYVKMT
jgi:hypothetical protein